MTTPPHPKKPKDVPADNPKGTLGRLAEGLKQVLAAPHKPIAKVKRRAPA